MTVLSIFRLFRSRLAHWLVPLVFFSTLIFAQHAQAQDLSFRVWAGEREIGTHTFTVREQATSTNVLSRALYNVKVLFVNVFRYDHEAQELWKGDCLTSLQSKTVENGETTTIRTQRQAEGLAVIRNDEPLLQTQDCVGTYAYWDKQRIQRDALMNSQTGEIQPATVADLGPQPLPRLEMEKPALQIDTDIASIRLWYSEDGQWLALQTETDGQPIIYLNEELL